MSTATLDAGTEQYWATVNDEVAALAGSPVEVEEIPERSNEVAKTFGLRFEGVGGYPLFAYLSVPYVEGPFVPLFQVPGYSSVTGIPALERRSRYTVLALCHRGQRLANSSFNAAFPGLLTDGLPGADTYRFREIVADSLRAIDVLLSKPEVDRSRLAISGNDVAALVASLRDDVKSLLIITPLLFSGVTGRLTGNDAYPLQEHNDFQRSRPDEWDEAKSTLGLFDPIARASRIDAAAFIACANGEKTAADALASGITGEAEVYVNTGYGYIDHKAQEDWLGDRAGVERSDGPFLPR
jgi:cephalosporin-C deacetylase